MRGFLSLGAVYKIVANLSFGDFISKINAPYIHICDVNYL